jgi:hypothetical protein
MAYGRVKSTYIVNNAQVTELFFPMLYEFEVSGSKRGVTVIIFRISGNFRSVLGTRLFRISTGSSSILIYFVVLLTFSRQMSV